MRGSGSLTCELLVPNWWEGCPRATAVAGCGSRAQTNALTLREGLLRANPESAALWGGHPEST